VLGRLLRELRIHGLAGVRESTELYRTLFEDLRFEVVDQVAEADGVASRWVLTGSNRGRQVRLWGITLSHLRDGRIVEDWTGFDSMELVRQLGLNPNSAGGTRAASSDASRPAQLTEAPCRNGLPLVC
jgi:predicted ester cyclase